MSRIILTYLLEGNQRVIRYDDGTVVTFGGEVESSLTNEDSTVDIVSRMTLTEFGSILNSTNPVIRGGWEMIKWIGLGELKKAKLNEFKGALVAANIMTANRANNLFNRKRQD